jgi:hypothetical protein
MYWKKYKIFRLQNLNYIKMIFDNITSNYFRKMISLPQYKKIEFYSRVWVLKLTSKQI